MNRRQAEPKRAILIGTVQDRNNGSFQLREIAAFLDAGGGEVAARITDAKFIIVGKENDRNARINGDNALGSVEPVGSRHPDVEDRQVGTLRLDDVNGLHPVPRDEYQVAFVFEFLLQEFAYVRAVVGE